MNYLIAAILMVAASYSGAPHQTIQLPDRIVVYHFSDRVETQNNLTPSRVRNAFSDKIAIYDHTRIKTIVGMLERLQLDHKISGIDSRWVIDGYNGNRRIWTVSFDRFFASVGLNGNTFQLSSRMQAIRDAISCVP